MCRPNRKVGVRTYRKRKYTQNALFGTTARSKQDVSVAQCVCVFRMSQNTQN